MNTETILWIFLPAVIGLFLIYKSTAISIRKRTLSSWFVTIVIWSAIGFAGIMLGNMYFNDAWPSFLPHIIITFSIGLILLQSVLAP